MVLLLLAVSVLCVWLFRVQLLTGAAEALIENDGAHKAEAAVVLGGDGFGTRIIKAAQLAQAGYVPYVLVSGPVYLNRHECDYTIQYAKDEGYPASLFRPLPTEADSTRSEAAYAGRYLRSHAIHHILLITSNYHTRRAAYLMRRQNPDLRVEVVSAPDPYFSPATWWQTRTGQKTFALEWAKVITSRLGM